MSGYDHKDPKNLRIAKEKLQKSLKRVNSELENTTTTYEAMAYSDIGKALAPHLRKNSLKALHIYQGELGGWYADIELKGMPPGIPRIMGTPVALPFETREEAEAAGDMLLLTLLATILRKNETKNSDAENAVLNFYDVSFPFPIEILRKFIHELGKPSDKRVSDAIRDMEELLVVNDEVVTSRLENADQALQQRIGINLMVILASDTFRWPESKEQPPQKQTRH